MSRPSVFCVLLAGHRASPPRLSVESVLLVPSPAHLVIYLLHSLTGYRTVACPGRTECVKCPIGLFASSAGQSTCLSCPEATFSSNGASIGSSACLLCAVRPSV